MSIYSNPNANKPIVLFGEEADMFLENNDIYLYEDCVVLEGEQAEAYKKRKAEEKADAEKSENDRMKRRYDMDPGDMIYIPAGSKANTDKDYKYIRVYNTDHDKQVGENDNKRAEKARDTLGREDNKRYDKAATARSDYYKARSKADGSNLKADLHSNMPITGPFSARKHYKKQQELENDAKFDARVAERKCKEYNKAADEYNKFNHSKPDTLSAINRRMRRDEKTGKKTFKESFIQSIEFI